MQSKLKLGPNQKIIIHWIFIVPIIGLLLSVVTLNPPFIIGLTFLLFLTIGLNRTSYIILTNDFLIIQKKNLIFIKTYERQISLDKISKIWIIERQMDNTAFSHDSFYWGAKIITGIAFYQPRFNLKIELENKQLEEIPINTQRIDIKKLKKRLESLFKSNFEYVELDLDPINQIKEELNVN